MNTVIQKSARLCAGLVVGLLALPASGDEGKHFGIGAGLDGDGTSIYLPLRAGVFLIEPRVSYSHSKEEADGSGAETEVSSDPAQNDTGVVTTREAFENTFLEVGGGLFGAKHLTETFELYYGGRLGYVKRKYINRNSTTVVGGASNRSWSYERRRDRDGYFLAPTLGFEYYPYPSVSLGAEIALRYEKLTGDSQDKSFSSSGTGTSTNFSYNTDVPGDNDEERFGTQTHVVLRAMF